jgi:hypothetical protein
MASRLLCASILAVVMGASSVAMAEPSAADKETARGLMTEGRSAREKGDLQGALKAFAGADALMHVPTTGLEVAKVQVALGLLVEARDTALRVARSKEGSSEPGPFKQARDAASAMTDELEARIPSVTVTLKGVPDGAAATVTIDDASVPSQALGQPRKLDPGHHVIVAKAGGPDSKQEIDLAEKDHKDVTLEVVPGTGPTGPAETTPTPTDTGAEQSASTGKSGFSKGLMFGGFGLAGAGVIAGSITGLLSMSKTNSIKSSPNCVHNGGSILCNANENSDISSAKSMATVSTIAFAAAGAGAVLGIIGLVTGNSSSPAPAETTPEKPPSDDAPAPATSTSHIEPWLGLGAAGLRGTF